MRKWLLTAGLLAVLPLLPASAVRSADLLDIAGLSLDSNGRLYPPRYDFSSSEGSPYDGWDSDIQHPTFGLVRLLYYSEGDWEGRNPLDYTVSGQPQLDGTGGMISGIRGLGPENMYYVSPGVNEKAYTTTNAAVSSTLGAGQSMHSLQDLYDFGLYVKFADIERGGDSAYVVVGNLFLNQSPDMNFGSDPEYRAGAADVPLGVFSPDGRAMILLKTGETSDGSYYIPLYTAHQQPGRVASEQDYVMAVMASSGTLRLLTEKPDLDITAGPSYAFAPVQLASFNAFARGMRDELQRLGLDGSFLAMDRTGFGNIGEYRFWGQANYVYDNQVEDMYTPGYVYREGGMTLGLDRRFADGHWFGGVAAGFGRGRMQEGDKSGDWGLGRIFVDAFNVGMYGGWVSGYNFANAGLGYALYNYKTEVGRRDGEKMDGSTWGGFVEAGRIFNREGYTITPTIGLDYAHLTPVGDFPMVDGIPGGFDIGSVQSLRTPARVTFRNDLSESFSLAGRVGFIRDWEGGSGTDYIWLRSDKGTKNYAALGAGRRPLPRNLYEVGFSLDYSLGAVTASLLYDFQWWGSNSTYGQGNFRNHNLRMEVGLGW